jgi:hypothetical protein
LTVSAHVLRNIGSSQLSCDMFREHPKAACPCFASTACNTTDSKPYVTAMLLRTSLWFRYTPIDTHPPLSHFHCSPYPIPPPPAPTTHHAAPWHPPVVLPKSTHALSHTPNMCQPTRPTPVLVPYSESKAAELRAAEAAGDEALVQQLKATILTLKTEQVRPHFTALLYLLTFLLTYSLTYSLYSPFVQWHLETSDATALCVFASHCTGPGSAAGTFAGLSGALRALWASGNAGVTCCWWWWYCSGVCC